MIGSQCLRGSGKPYVDYQKTGHSARQAETKILKVYSKMPY